MSDVETPAEATEAQALEAANAGYAKARGLEPPAKASTSEQATTASADALSGGSEGEPATPTGSPAPAPAPAVPTVTEEFASLKAKVRVMEESGSASAQDIRRLHGEIGNLNRTIKALQTEKAAPAGDDKLAAALTKAKKVADEYPELGGPLVEALELLSTRTPSPAPAPQEQPQEQQAQPSGYTPEQQAAIKAIDEAVPDRLAINASQPFREWIAKQTPEYQSKHTTSWNPAVVSQMYADFRAHRAADEAREAAKKAERERKNDRLAANESPQGVPSRAQPTTLPDDAGYQRGYDKVRRLGK